MRSKYCTLFFWHCSNSRARYMHATRHDLRCWRRWRCQRSIPVAALFLKRVACCLPVPKTVQSLEDVVTRLPDSCMITQAPLLATPSSCFQIQNVMLPAFDDAQLELSWHLGSGDSLKARRSLMSSAHPCMCNQSRGRGLGRKRASAGATVESYLKGTALQAVIPSAVMWWQGTNLVNLLAHVVGWR